MFKLKHIATYYGANPYIDKKAMVFEIEHDLKNSYSQFKARAQEVLDAMPIDFGRFDIEGGNSKEDILSLLAIELLNYKRGDLRYSFSKDSKIFMDFHSPKVNAFVLNKILKWFRGNSFDVDNFLVDLQNIWSICKINHPDFQAHALIEYAKNSNISYHNLGSKIWTYGTGRGSKVFFETSAFEDMNLERLSKSKCKEIFHDIGVRYPKYICKSEFSNLNEIISEINFPCVVKPNDSGGGKGVTANIDDINQLHFAINHAKAHSKSGLIVIEEHLSGFDHRLLVVAGQFKGCVKSEAPFVVGDGEKTINELILEKNRLRTESFYKSGYKRPIKIDDALINKLSIQELKVSDVLESGRKVYLRNNSNLGGGGDSTFVDQVHPEIINQALKIASHVGMFSTGIDYITEDISKSPELVHGGFTELNKTPGVPVFVNAGFSPKKVGSFFLEDICYNVPLDVYIIKDFKNNIGSFFDGSYVFPNSIIKGNKRYKLDYQSFDQCWGRYVSDKSLDRLNFVISEGKLKNFGILEGVDRVFLASECCDDTKNFLKYCNVNYTVVDLKKYYN